MVDVQPLLARQRFLDHAADPANHLAGSLAVLDDTIERLLDLGEIRRLRSQPAQGRLSVGDDRGNRLVDFMGDRGRELAHCRKPICVH